MRLSGLPPLLEMEMIVISGGPVGCVCEHLVPDQATPGHGRPVGERGNAFRPGRRLTAALPTKQQPSLAERLGEADVQTLIHRYRAGTTARELADHLDCSLSTIKRLLRARNVRLTS